MTVSNDILQVIEYDTGTKNHKHVEDDIEKKGVYYDATVPRNDPTFLGPVRRWEKRMGFESAIIYRNVFFFIFLHLAAIVGIWYAQKASLKMILFTMFIVGASCFGVTGGAHRYWTHRSYEANLPFRVILVLCYATAGQNKIFEWVRDHRVHHKCSETTADPHNIQRGFFFAHIGWLMMKKHPHVIQEGKKIYLEDIRNDPVVTIYTRYFEIMNLFCCIILPTIIPVYFWDEEWTVSFFSCILRYVSSLNGTWAVNSFAHIWGNKPYNPSIHPTENWIVSFLTMGEGWHNYHHTFPWDYKASELAYFLNMSTVVIDAFAKIGWVYDRKQATRPQIQQAIDKQGKI